MKIEQYLRSKPTAKIKTQESLFNIYQKEKENREVIAQLHLAIEGKKDSIHRLDATIKIREEEHKDVSNKIGLAIDYLETIHNDVSIAQQDLLDVKRNLNEANVAIMEMEVTTYEKQKMLETTSIDVNIIERAQTELDQLNADVALQRQQLEKLNIDFQIKQREIEDYNHTYQNRINMLTALEIAIQEAAAQLEEEKNK